MNFLKLFDEILDDKIYDTICKPFFPTYRNCKQKTSFNFCGRTEEVQGERIGLFFKDYFQMCLMVKQVM